MTSVGGFMIPFSLKRKGIRVELRGELVAPHAQLFEIQWHGDDLRGVIELDERLTRFADVLDQSLEGAAERARDIARLTADAATSWARAVAVRGNRIVAVGGDREVMELAGPSTRVIDLRGRTVTPGWSIAMAKHDRPPRPGTSRFVRAISSA